MNNCNWDYILEVIIFGIMAIIISLFLIFTIMIVVPIVIILEIMIRIISIIILYFYDNSYKRIIITLILF